MARTKSIVPVSVFESTIVDPRQMDAIDALTKKRVPKNAIKQHPGKGGKMFTYIDHVWITETLQHGLGNAWSFDVQDYEVFTDSVVVRGTLKVLFPISPGARKAGDPLFFERTITEIGSFDAGGGKMATSNMIASAASRCLCRCVMRMFGVGIEFYKEKDEAITPSHAWTTLKDYAIKQKVDWTPEFEKSFIEAMQAKGITRENIVDRYADAYKILNEIIGKVRKDEPMPEIGGEHGE